MWGNMKGQGKGAKAQGTSGKQAQGKQACWEGWDIHVSREVQSQEEW